MQSFDQTVTDVTLSEGWNVLLVKVTEEKGQWQFAVRLTNLDGSPATGLREGEPDEATIERAKNLSAGDTILSTDAKIARGPIDTLRARIAAKPEDARAHYLLGTLLRQIRAHDKADHPDSDAIRRALEIDDKPAAYHYELAQSFTRQTSIAAQRDDNAWRHSLEAAEARGALRASYELASYYESTFENHSRAIAILDSLLEKNTGHVSALFLKGRIENDKRIPGAWRRAVRAAAKAAPKSYGVQDALIDLQIEDEALDQRERAALLQKQFERQQLHVATRWETADALLRAGARSEAKDLIAAYRDHNPYSTRVEERLADLALGEDDVLGAIRQLDAALRKRPEDHRLLDRLARAHWQLGSGERAIALWERSLELQPNQPELRERVEFLQKTESRFEDEFRVDGEKIARAAQKETYENTDGDSARVLLELAAVEVNRDGTAREYSQQVIQVLNEAGIRYFASSRTPFADGDQIVEFRSAKVYRTDGTSEESRLRRHGRGGGGTNWRYAIQSLPALNVGDVVEVSFVKEDVRQSFFGDYFVRREILRGPLPIRERTFVLRVPSERKFYFHQRHIDAKPATERDEEKGTTTYTWKLENLARLKQEPAMPWSKEILPLVEVSTFEDWTAFNSWYWNLIKRQFESSPEIDKKVAELVSGKDTEMEKIRAIYNFVVTDIRYNAWEFGVHGFKPYLASKVFARRFGDCKDKATLMTVMLDKVGVTSHPVLIYADQRRGAEDLSLPMVNHFNHCISYIPAKGDRPELYLDGTASFHSTEELPSMDRGAEVLIVRERGPLVQQIPWNTSADLAVDEIWKVDLRPYRSARVHVDIRVRGDFAVYVRSNFEIEAQRVETLKKTLGTRFAGAEVVSQSFSDLSNLDQPVTMSFAFDVPDFATMSPEGWTLGVPDDFFGSTRGVGILSTLVDRETDLVLGNPRRSSIRVEYQLPEGVSVKSTPAAVDETTNYGRLLLSVREAPSGSVQLEKVFELHRARVPQSEYTRFRELAAKVDLIAKEKIVLEN